MSVGGQTKQERSKKVERGWMKGGWLEGKEGRGEEEGREGKVRR